jgi:DHA1 family bicyclomycin/chloramphenicol resistance-like MFS transporter
MAPVIGPFFGSQTLVLFGWRAIFWVLASFGTACLIAVALRLPETLPQARRASGGIGTALQAYAKLLRDRHYLGFTAQSNFAFAGMFAYIAGSPFVFIELFGVSPQDFGLLFGLNAVGIVIASQVNAWLVHRFGPARMLRIGLLIYLAAALALLAGAVTAAGLAAIAAPLFLCVSMMGVVTPNSMALALEPYPHAAGSASALSGTLQFSVGAPIVALLGILHDGSALPMAYVVATCALVAMAINLMTRHRGALDARG